MKLIPGHPNEELQEAGRLAEALRQTTEATVAGTVPLIPDLQHRRITPEQIGPPPSLVPGADSLARQLKEAKAEIAELREQVGQAA